MEHPTPYLLIAITDRVSEPDAEEIVQDTLLKVYSSVRKFRRTDRAQFTTWVCEVAKNLAIDFGRRRKLPTRQLKNEDFPAVAPREEPAHRNESFAHWLRDELAKFPPDDQRILLWREEDHSYEVIAKWLGIKVVTARVRHKRAKDRIIEAANRTELFGSNGVHDDAESGVIHE